MNLYEFKKKIILELVRPRRFLLINFFIYYIHFILGLLKRREKNYGSPILIWDSRREPITFDFTNFILNALNEFNKKGISYFELIIFYPKDYIFHTFEYENYNLFVDSNQYSKRIKEIIYKLAESYNCIKEIKIVYDSKKLQKIIKKSILVYPYNYHPIYYQPETLNYRKMHTLLKNNDNYIIPEIEAKLDYSKKFDQFLSLIENNNFITLTLRDYGFDPCRNTTNKDVIEVTKLAKKLKFKIVIIPDNKEELVNYPISEESLICFSARENLKNRIYLYSKSKINIFQPSGPAYVSLYIRGSKSIMLNVGNTGFDNNEKHWKNDYNLNPGDQPYMRLECFMMWFRFYKNYSFEDLLNIYNLLYSKRYF